MQVKIHRLLLQSRFRTRKKEEANLFFVPAYVKCVRMMGGLNDKEINSTYVKVFFLFLNNTSSIQVEVVIIVSDVNLSGIESNALF